MSDSVLQAQFAAISAQRSATYANNESFSSFGWSEGPNVLCSRCLYNPCIRRTLGLVSWSMQNACTNWWCSSNWFSVVQVHLEVTPLFWACRAILNAGQRRMVVAQSTIHIHSLLWSYSRRVCSACFDSIYELTITYSSAWIL